MKFIQVTLIALSFLVFSSALTSAEDQSTPVKKTVKKKKQKEKKGIAHREKEAEGTEALNRFEANTVIRSHYQHNGEALQVDPD